MNIHLARYNPRYNLMNRQNNLASFFDGFLDDFFSPAVQLMPQTGSTTERALHVDIYEKDNVIIIEADLPGVTRENIKLDVKGRQLTLGGERKSDEEIQEEHRYRRERRFGKFERTFSMPFDIDVEKVVATHENGILRLEIPRPEEKQSKQITIQ
jgi:HSP20 family protein